MIIAIDHGNYAIKTLNDQKYLALQKLRKSLGGETDDQK